MSSIKVHTKTRFPAKLETTCLRKYKKTVAKLDQNIHSIGKHLIEPMTIVSPNNIFKKDTRKTRRLANKSGNKRPFSLEKL